MFWVWVYLAWWGGGILPFLVLLIYDKESGSNACNGASEYFFLVAICAVFGPLLFLAFLFDTMYLAPQHESELPSLIYRLIHR